MPPLRVVDLMVNALKSCPRHTHCPKHTHVETTCGTTSDRNCDACAPSLAMTLDELRAALQLKVGAGSSAAKRTGKSGPKRKR